MKNETGNIYGKLKVLSLATTRNNSTNGSRAWLCECECGSFVNIRGDNLRNGNTKSCGCIPRKPKNETGNVYGRLTVLSLHGKNNRKNYLWLCRCECGNIVIINGSTLRNGNTKSCGCLQKELISRLFTKDETGNIYGMLKVIGPLDKNKHGEYIWSCQCECGNELAVKGGNLRNGKVENCGCSK